jgi:hypothetical protein
LEKRFIRKQKEIAGSHLGQLISMFIVMFYYLYLELIRKQLDVMNCVPTNPPDGYEYMQAVGIRTPRSGSGMWSGRCWKEGEDGLHLFILPYAISGFILYGIGFPLCIGLVLYRKRVQIEEDQILRAHNTGDTKVTNPSAFEVRRRYYKVCMGVWWCVSSFCSLTDTRL